MPGMLPQPIDVRDLDALRGIVSEEFGPWSAALLITQDMVGKTIGQFVSIECKHENWRPGEDGARGVAQLNWANLINTLGGYAIFTKDGRIV